MAHPHTCCSRVGPLRPLLSAPPPAEHVAGSPLNPAAATTWSGILKTHLDSSLLRTLAKLLHSRLGPDYTWEDLVGSLVNVSGRGFYGLTCSPLSNLEHRRFRLSPTTLTFRIDWSLIFVYSRGSGHLQLPFPNCLVLSYTDFEVAGSQPGQPPSGGLSFPLRQPAPERTLDLCTASCAPL